MLVKYEVFSNEESMIKQNGCTSCDIRNDMHTYMYIWFATWVTLQTLLAAECSETNYLSQSYFHGEYFAYSLQYWYIILICAISGLWWIGGNIRSRSDNGKPGRCEYTTYWNDWFYQDCSHHCENFLYLSIHDAFCLNCSKDVAMTRLLLNGVCVWRH